MSRPHQKSLRCKRNLRFPRSPRPMSCLQGRESMGSTRRSRTIEGKLCSRSRSRHCILHCTSNCANQGCQAESWHCRGSRCTVTSLLCSCKLQTGIWSTERMSQGSRDCTCSFSRRCYPRGKGKRRCSFDNPRKHLQPTCQNTFQPRSSNREVNRMCFCRFQPDNYCR